AGKSTFHAEALSGIGLPLINADEIALDISTRTARAVDDLAYEAMHRAETLRAELVDQRLSFIMETVLSDTQGAKLAFFATRRPRAISRSSSTFLSSRNLISSQPTMPNRTGPD